MQKLTNFKVADGFSNVYRGLGGKRDIKTNTTFVRNKLLTLYRQELNDLYAKNWIAGKVVDIPVSDALREDREIECEDGEAKEVFLEALEEFDVEEKLRKLMTWGKIFGSAVMIIVSKDAPMDEELIIENIKQGDLENLAVFDRFDLFPDALNRNPLSKRYLQPEHYRLSKSGGLIHHTRVIKYDGVDTTNFDKELLQGFGVSVYERLIDTIMNANISPDLLINLLSQSNIDVFKILGLNEALVNDEDEAVIKRLGAIQDGKSLFNGVALDKEDDYINVAKNFGGLSEINKELYQIVVGAADIPFSRFMGASLTGLNPTGAGEMKNYYDKVKGEQKRIEPFVTKIDKIIQMHTFGRLLKYNWKWASLFQMSEEQKMAIAKQRAETVVAYMNMGVVDEMEAKAGLVGSDLFPTITAESFEAEKLAYEELANAEPEPYEE